MSNPQWRKSTKSDAGNCVEFAPADGALVRDSKDVTGPVLSFPAGSWTAFVNELKKDGLAQA